MSTNNRTPETGNRTDHISGLPTGFVKIDEMLGGLHPSELIVLASRPSMGKTALAANIAEDVSIETKRPVLFFSLEMGQTELAVRLLCSRARVRKRDFASNFLDDDDRHRLADTRDELNNSLLFIDDTSAPTVSQIAAAARRIKQQNGLALIVLQGTVLALSVGLFTPWFINLFGATEQVFPYALTYMRIIAIGIPFLAFTAGGTLLIRSDGSPRYALICNLAGVALNTVLDWLFLFPLKMVESI